MEIVLRYGDERKSAPTSTTTSMASPVLPATSDKNSEEGTAEGTERYSWDAFLTSTLSISVREKTTGSAATPINPSTSDGEVVQHYVAECLLPLWVVLEGMGVGSVAERLHKFWAMERH